MITFLSFLFYGWSKKVSKKIVKEYKCIMLHPSNLPKYAGGSTIQNQIIRNVKLSAVTLIGLLLLSKFLIVTIDLSLIITPPHLLGRNGLIGVTASLLESKLKIGPNADKL